MSDLLDLVDILELLFDLLTGPLDAHPGDEGLTTLQLGDSRSHYNPMTPIAVFPVSRYRLNQE